MTDKTVSQKELRFFWGGVIAFLVVLIVLALVVYFLNLSWWVFFILWGILILVGIILLVLWFVTHRKGGQEGWMEGGDELIDTDAERIFAPMLAEGHCLVQKHAVFETVILKSHTPDEKCQTMLLVALYQPLSGRTAILCAVDKKDRHSYIFHPVPVTISRDDIQDILEQRLNKFKERKREQKILREVDEFGNTRSVTTNEFFDTFTQKKEETIK